MIAAYWIAQSLWQFTSRGHHGFGSSISHFTYRDDTYTSRRPKNDEESSFPAVAMSILTGIQASCLTIDRPLDMLSTAILPVIRTERQDLVVPRRAFAWISLPERR